MSCDIGCGEQSSSSRYCDSTTRAQHDACYAISTSSPATFVEVFFLSDFVDRQIKLSGISCGTMDLSDARLTKREREEGQSSPAEHKSCIQ